MKKLLKGSFLCYNGAIGMGVLQNTFFLSMSKKEAKNENTPFKINKF